MLLPPLLKRYYTVGEFSSLQILRCIIGCNLEVKMQTCNENMSLFLSKLTTATSWVEGIQCNHLANNRRVCATLELIIVLCVQH
jgi:hypothetical protein